jgi:hypothetical protein
MNESTIVRESPLKIQMIMKAHWNAKEPFNLSGEPSTVKSELIKQTSKEICIEENENRTFVEWSKCSLEEKKNIYKSVDKYFIFEDLRASETDIGELRLQNMRTSDEYITYQYSMLFMVLSNPKAKGVLFFDEMNLANNLIKAQFYKVYNDHSIGDMPLSDNILVCSAGNESSQVRDVVQDSVALITRRGNYFLNPLTNEEFISYALDVNMHRSIIGYLSFQPGDVHDLKYDMVESLGQPCARTWKKLSNIRLKNQNMNLDELAVIARGLVGQGVATKYIAYAEMDEAIRIQDVIKNPAKVAEMKKTQIQYVVISGLLSLFKQGDNDIFGTMCEVSLHLPETMAVYMMRMLKQTSGDNKFKKLAMEKYNKEFTECWKRYGDLLK